LTIHSERLGRWLTLLVALGALGCVNSPINLAQGVAPWRQPRPDCAATFEDSLTGGEVFSMYCNQCHNARQLAERPFASYQNVAAHMRVRANLTGEEYAKLMEFLRRFHDVPSPTPPGAVEPSPKRLIFAQPVAELRDQMPAPGGPQPGAAPAAAPAAAQPQPALAPAGALPEAIPAR
jgi:hypothetical protein